MKLFNLLWLPVAGVAGATYLAQANSPQPQPEPETLKVWKIKQLADKNFGCDCNGCRVAAAQVGVTLN